MTSLSAMEMRTIDGGASSYVNCPICGQRVKVGIFSRLFRSNRQVEALLTSDHGLLKNYGRSIKHKVA